MRTLSQLTFAAILTLASIGQIFAASSTASLTMKNPMTPRDKLMTGGQPSAQDLESLASQGVEVVINLRAKGEFDEFNEAELAKKLGLTYYRLEISDSSDISRANAQKLDQLMSQSDGETLVHCASGNRVGSLLALREYFVKGQSAEASMSFGKASGMTRLTDKTRQVIESKPKN